MWSKKVLVEFEVLWKCLSNIPVLDGLQSHFIYEMEREERLSNLVCIPALLDTLLACIGNCFKDVSVHKLWIQRLSRSRQLQQRMWLRRASWRRIKIAKEVSKQSGQRIELAESKSSPQQIGGGWGGRRLRRRQESAAKIPCVKERWCNQCWTSSSGAGWLYCLAKVLDGRSCTFFLNCSPSLREPGDRTGVTTAATHAPGGWNWIPACLLPPCWWLVLETWLGGQENTLQLLPWPWKWAVLGGHSDTLIRPKSAGGTWWLL